jgi:hypothetical protein
MQDAKIVLFDDDTNILVIDKGMYAAQQNLNRVMKKKYGLKIITF